MLDLRSDTVTTPTAAMLEAMQNAQVGDDILGEDLSVKELEALGAQMLGMEAGVFTVSGTMSNQLAVMTLTGRGEEVLVGENSHIYNLEVGGLAALSQVQVRSLKVDKGYFAPEEVAAQIRPKGVQSPKTALICLENTYDLNRGYPVTAENTREIINLGKRYEISVYIDGARIFNAAQALDVDVRELTKGAAAVQVCLTKGLAAPFGALLTGDAAFAEKARWYKQRIGGGFRQAGYMAACATAALKTMVARLKDDQANARLLAEQLRQIDPSLVELDDVRSNIVSIDTASFAVDDETILRQMLAKGIKIKHIGSGRFRMICHKDIQTADIAAVAGALKEILQA